MNQPPDTDTQVLFYGPEFYCLSNFSSFQLTWMGFTFPTSEHAYQWMKFLYENPEKLDALLEIRDSIRFARSAHDAFKIAENFAHFRRPGWDQIKLGIMLEICTAKARQHEYVRRKLRQTGTREIIEDSWRDSYWGWGPDKRGLNHLGKVWMQVREIMRSEYATAV